MLFIAKVAVKPGKRVITSYSIHYTKLYDNEYNLALGERRAASAKKYLIQYGIAESRIRTVSYGEERPLFTGTNEDDYAHNRRDDFILV